MGIFGKTEQERLTDTIDYLYEMKAPLDKVKLLWDWVYTDGPFQPTTTSEALSLGFGVFNRRGTTKDARRAIRAVILARLAVETPNLAQLSTTSGAWKITYQPKKEDQLKSEITTWLGRLGAAPSVAVVAPVGVTPVN